MEKPRYHIFVCNSFRVGGEPQGVCNKRRAHELPQYLETEISDRGLDAMVSTCGCLKICERGPAMVIYPEAWWYGELDEDRVDTILDALEEDAPAEDLLLA